MDLFERLFACDSFVILSFIYSNASFIYFVTPPLKATGSNGGQIHRKLIYKRTLNDGGEGKRRWRIVGWAGHGRGGRDRHLKSCHSLLDTMDSARKLRGRLVLGVTVAG